MGLGEWIGLSNGWGEREERREEREGREGREERRERRERSVSLTCHISA